jgi:hypothetical protein
MKFIYASLTKNILQYYKASLVCFGIPTCRGVVSFNLVCCHVFEGLVTNVLQSSRVLSRPRLNHVIQSACIHSLNSSLCYSLLTKISYNMFCSVMLHFVRGHSFMIVLKSLRLIHYTSRFTWKMLSSNLQSCLI